MALSSRIVRLDLYDADGSGAINVDVHYEISTNNAEALALGAGKRGVVVRMEAAPRASAVAAIASLLAASLVVDDGGWPEGAIALPRPRKP